MIKWIGLAAAATLALGAPAAQAADDVYLAIYADRSIAYVDQATGKAHAFLCLTKAAGAPQPGDACYGFFARPEAVTSITFENGAGLKRTAGQDWLESPSGFHFTQTPTPGHNIVLADPKRQLTWVLASPHGGSLMSTPKAKQPGPHVKGITFTAGGAGFIGGDAVTGPYQEVVLPPAASNVAFHTKVSQAQFAGLLSAIGGWNTAPHHLDRDGYISAISAVVTGIGGKAPTPKAGGTEADYVAAVAALNR